MSNNQNQVVTLGCRLNIFESEVIKNQLEQNNLHNKIVVNTCCVTKRAEKQSLKSIKKLKKLHPAKDIIVTGCAVHTSLDILAAMPEVSKVIDNANKFNHQAFISNKKIAVVKASNEPNKNSNTQASSAHSSSEALKPYTIPKLNYFENKTRAFIQIQQGCDHRCSFCIIYQARGTSISLSKEEIIAEVKKVVAAGHQEVILTGVDISSWGIKVLTKEASKLGKLCQDILREVKDLKRLRLSSLDPAVKDQAILELLQNEERFMPHLHLSLQSMSTPVLNNMGRRHSKESAIQYINELKAANPNLVIGADIICGFPRETEEQFLETKKTLLALNLPLIHAFPYSERSGTPAAKMSQLPILIRKQRTLDLIAQSNIIKQEFFKQRLNSQQEILVEVNNTGYTKDYFPVKIIGNPIPKNTLVKVTITAYDDKNLIGVPLNV